MPIIGIDLGTTFSAVSLVRDGKPEIIPVGDDRIMPSVVGLSPEGQWMVGRAALNQWVLYPDRTVRSIKRKMGSDERVSLNDNVYTPPQVSAMILRALKSAAEQDLNTEVSQAVITVPAYFSDIQRQATIDAGRIAGLEVMRIINEPTAAALAYGLDRSTSEVALVYDLGGGTFDVSLVELSDGVVDVRASHGNTRLGGDDFDERLATWLQQQFEAQHGIDLRGNRQALARIRRAAEQAKIELSKEPFTWVREEYLAQKRSAPLHMEVEVSRVQFVSLIDDLLASTLISIDRVLTDAGIDAPDHVMLVGGSTYIPAIGEIVAEHTGVIPRQDVNPSEAVALGAGIQGAIIAGEPIDAILVDVTPYSLGIAVAELMPFGGMIPDRLKVLIRRNSTIPATQREVFHTLYPGQTAAQIEVYQGDNPIASENALLGEFLFENLQPERPGEPASVTIQFDINVSGVLKVTAVDRGSSRESGIIVQASRQQLSHADIQTARLALPEVSPMSDLPADLLRETEVLLARANTVLERTGDPDLEDCINAVLENLEAGAGETLRVALDDLTDVLYDLEDEA
jgi:molecular chaperone DnaK